MRFIQLIPIFLYLVSQVAIAAERPNILLLVAEDLSPRIGAFGDSLAKTPNLDELAGQSIRFDQVFTTAGVCAPSRAALISGQHQIAFGGQHMRSSTGPLGLYYAQPAEEVRAFPEILRAAGYYTFTDQKLDYQFSGIRAGSGPFTIWDQDGAGDFAWRDRKPEQPFFGLINFIETHESGVMRQTGPVYSQAHAVSQHMRLQVTQQITERTPPEEVSVPVYYPDNADTRADIARHYDNIQVMDRRVGRILAALKADGLWQNTIVIWTTDHGDGLPRAKREVLDSGIHVPFLLHLPGNTEASSNDQLVSFVDLAPSILTWAGLTPPAYLHGTAIQQGGREYVFASRDRIDEVQDRQRAVRDHRYKLIRSYHPDVAGGHKLNYRDNIDMVRTWRAAFQADELTPEQSLWFQPAGEWQLYDLAVDPHELNNLAGKPAYADVQARLAAALAAFQARVGDTSDMPETELRARLTDQGEVPTTPPPELSISNGLLTVTSSHSVGYRIEGSEAWQLYSQPLTPPADKTLEFKAQRYGWQASPIVTYPN